MKKLNQKGNNGITLIALVITIIVLLILAGVAINMAIDSDGLFGKANEAAIKWNSAVGEEEEGINDLLNTLDEISPTFKPMITKWNIVAGDEIAIMLYTPKDMLGNDLENNTNVTIDWGDGTVENYTSSNMILDENNNGGVNHKYSITNEQTTVTITGECIAIAVLGLPQLTSIEQWGYTGSLIYAFPSTGLTKIASPEKNTFANVTDFTAAFASCEALTEIPEGLFANCALVTSFEATFADCLSLTEIPKGLFANCASVTSFNETFAYCWSLTEIPEGLFANCASVTSFEETFADCASLTTIGAHAFDGCSGVASFENLFGNSDVRWLNRV